MQRTILSALSLLIWLSSSFIFSQQAPPQEVKISPELKASIEKGKVIYESNCVSCHMPTGEGISGAFPPLAKSDYLMKDRERSIRQTIFGVEGEIVVNGETYYGMMPPTGLNDEQVAHVLNYVRNTWGNSDPKLITKEEVAKVRAKGNNG